MTEFQIIVDYDNILENNPKLGSGMRGSIFEYKIEKNNPSGEVYIIKQQECKDLQYKPIYSKEENPFIITNTYKINKSKKLAEIINKLKHFVKIKGYVVFPNLEGDGCILESIIYENAGKLIRKILPFNKKNELQLLEILKEFKILNVAGYFHGDTQGCNNIEPNQNNFLYVIDYEDIRHYDNDSKISLYNIIIDLEKVLSCIVKYLTQIYPGKINGLELNDDTKIYLISELKKKNIKFYDYNGIQELKFDSGIFYLDSFDINKVDSNKRNFIYSINNSIKYLEYINISFNVNLCFYLFLLHDYINNYNEINKYFFNLLTEIKVLNKPNLNDYINEAYFEYYISLKYSTFFFKEISVDFKDIKTIIESCYNHYIEKYKDNINLILDDIHNKNLILNYKYNKNIINPKQP